MDIIVKPLTEEAILEITNKKTTIKKILIDLREKEQFCVNHLCGCK